MLPEEAPESKAYLYVRNARTKELYLSGEYITEKGKWFTLQYSVPAMEGVLLDEMGFAFEICAMSGNRAGFDVYVDDLYAAGGPDYTIDFAKEKE